MLTASKGQHVKVESGVFLKASDISDTFNVLCAFKKKTKQTGKNR